MLLRHAPYTEYHSEMALLTLLDNGRLHLPGCLHPKSLRGSQPRVAQAILSEHHITLVPSFE